MGNKPEKTGLLDPRQKLFWDKYVDPESPTFNNIRQSAIAAGYAETTADKVSETEWFQGRLRRLNMRTKGEKVLDEMLDIPVQTVKTKFEKSYDHITDEFRTVEVTSVVTDPSMVKIKQDTAKFVVERLGKDDWSTRQEVTGAGGEALIDLDAKRKSDEAIDDFLNTNPAGADQVHA